MFSPIFDENSLYLYNQTLHTQIGLFQSASLVGITLWHNF